jgi:shikimate dehydrogenase
VDRYAVVGHPISHSRSPWIHAQFAAQTAQSMQYTAMDVDPAQFEASIARFFVEGGAGLNITVPFKERACAMARKRSPAVDACGAANTLYLDAEGLLCAENTDGHGLLQDLVANHGACLAERRILLLGAGGAVRGVIPALLEHGPAHIGILNRSHDKAVQLAKHFRGEVDIKAWPAETAFAQPFDLIINGTSAGLHGDLPSIPAGVLHSQTWCYDMVYGKGETAFVQWARRAGAAKAIDGIGMLVEQAARAFSIWRGVTPQTAAIIQALRQELAAPSPGSGL